MKKFVIIPLFFVSLIILGQTTDTLQGNTICIKGITTNIPHFETTTRLADVDINVYKYNTKIKTYHANTKGRFEFRIPKNSYIVIEFEKDGFVSKRILFDTRTDQEFKCKPFNLEVVLLDYVKGVDYGDLDFPITRIEYDKKINDFNYVVKYTEMMLKKQEKVLAVLTQN